VRFLRRDPAASLAAVAAAVLLVVALLLLVSTANTHESRIREEFARLGRPAAFTIVTPFYFSKLGTGVIVGTTYRSSLTSAAVETFYTGQMAAMGWHPVRSTWPTPPISCWAKDDLRAALHYPGESGVSREFTVLVMWASPECE